MPSSTGALTSSLPSWKPLWLSIPLRRKSKVTLARPSRLLASSESYFHLSPQHTPPLLWPFLTLCRGEQNKRFPASEPLQVLFLLPTKFSLSAQLTLLCLLMLTSGEIPPLRTDHPPAHSSVRRAVYLRSCNAWCSPRSQVTLSQLLH